MVMVLLSMSQCVMAEGARDECGVCYIQLWRKSHKEMVGGGILANSKDGRFVLFGEGRDRSELKIGLCDAESLLSK